MSSAGMVNLSAAKDFSSRMSSREKSTAPSGFEAEVASGSLRSSSASSPVAGYKLNSLSEVVGRALPSFFFRMSEAPRDVEPLPLTCFDSRPTMRRSTSDWLCTLLWPKALEAKPSRLSFPCVTTSA